MPSTTRRAFHTGQSAATPTISSGKRAVDVVVLDGGVDADVLLTPVGGDELRVASPPVRSWQSTTRSEASSLSIVTTQATVSPARAPSQVTSKTTMPPPTVRPHSRIWA